MNEASQNGMGSAAWLCVAALALGGYVLAIAPAERRLTEIGARAHQFYDLANRNERLLGAASGLSAARDRVATDVTRLAGERGAGSATLRTLAVLQRESSRGRVTIGALTPDAAAPSPDNAGSMDLAIAMSGMYRDVVSAIADLSRHGVLLEVSDATLSSGEPGAEKVDATLHATLYYRMDALEKEKHGPLQSR